ncbi:MAG: serine/threonine-protein kinase [Candidatus Micrarchaeota archaeon]
MTHRLRHSHAPSRPAPYSGPLEEFRRHFDSDVSALGLPSVPGYRLHREIGKGGMGRVYLASDESGRECALKLFPNFPEWDESAYLKEWFLRECAALLAISHPNVVSSFEAGATEDFLYLSMEVVRGRTLHRLLQEEGPLPWPAAKSVMDGVCAGLHAAHETGVVHRDIKPENVLVVESNGGISVKVIDFGLCHIDGYEEIYSYVHSLEHPFAPQISPVDGDFGTPEFRPPEFDEPGMNKRRTFDVYSAGVLLFEMVCGRHPLHPGSPGGAVLPGFLRSLQFSGLHKNGKVPKPSELGIRMPEKAESALMRSLEKSPAHRFASMEEMRDAMAL